MSTWWGALGSTGERRCCGAPCSRIVRIRALVQCPVGSKLTSSGGRALQGCTDLGTQKVGIYVYHIHPYRLPLTPPYR